MMQRFYEKDPTVKQAVEVMLIFPADFQSVIAKTLSVITEKEFHTDKRLKDLKSLGTDKIMAIHKSKRKGRHYDQFPAVHQAMNSLMILEPEERNFVAAQIIELMNFVQAYIKTCKAQSIPPTVNTVEALANVYVQLGADESRKFLEALEVEFRRRLRGLAAEAIQPMEPTQDTGKAICSEDSGMRIRKGLQP